MTMLNTRVDGSKSKYSKAVVIAVAKPPRWANPFGANDAAIAASNLTFKNIFVYNFYTQDERTRYSFANPKYQTSPNSLVDTAIKDITGNQVRGQAHWERVFYSRPG